MSRLTELGERDGWRCWICDDPVDPLMSVNDPRGPSSDSVTTKAKAKNSPIVERLAHRGCNTKKGAVSAVIPWATDLFVADAAPILGSVERLEHKGGRVAMGRCSTADDAAAAAIWLVDRISRLRPQLNADASVEAGGGQFVVVLTCGR